MGEARQRRGKAVRGDYPPPKLVTLMAMVRVERRPGTTSITLEPAGEPWVIPPESRLRGQLSFPVHPSDASGPPAPCICGHTWLEHQPRGGANESEHCRALGGCRLRCSAYLASEKR